MGERRESWLVCYADGCGFWDGKRHPRAQGPRPNPAGCSLCGESSSRGLASFLTFQCILCTFSRADARRGAPVMGSTKRRLPRDWAPSRLVCTECNALLGLHLDDRPLAELISVVRNRLYHVRITCSVPWVVGLRSARGVTGRVRILPYSRGCLGRVEAGTR